MLISIDFDGTIVEHAFPKIGEPLPKAFEVLKKLQEAGHRLILNTCREDYGYKIDKQYLTEAVKFCEENGVTFVSVNENSPEDDFRPEKEKNRKVYAELYIDDRNLGGFPGWAIVEELLLKENPDGRLKWLATGEN